MSLSGSPQAQLGPLDRLKKLFTTGAMQPAPRAPLPQPPKPARGYAGGGDDRTRIVVNVKSRIYAQIAALAQDEGCTVSEMVRRLITKGLARAARDGRMPDKED